MLRRKKLWFKYQYEKGTLEAYKTSEEGLWLVITEEGGTPQSVGVPREYVSNIIQWLTRAFPNKEIANVIRLEKSFSPSKSSGNPDPST